jgi:ATP adenylyltransferase
MADFARLAPDTLSEMMAFAQRILAALGELYHPEGFNLGMNLGQCAGAGVADHLHLHVLPRWSADANFMTSIGETRILPEDLATTYEKLTEYLRGKWAGE